VATPGFEPKTYDEALGHLIEEAGEVQSAAGKMVRFGPLSFNPLLPPDQRETNEEWLDREMTDLIAAVITMRRFIHKRRFDNIPIDARVIRQWR
jgi:hypothetical protein